MQRATSSVLPLIVRRYASFTNLAIWPLLPSKRNSPSVKRRRKLGRCRTLEVGPSVPWLALRRSAKEPSVGVVPCKKGWASEPKSSAEH